MPSAIKGKDLYVESVTVPFKLKHDYMMKFALILLLAGSLHAQPYIKKESRSRMQAIYLHADTTSVKKGMEALNRIVKGTGWDRVVIKNDSTFKVVGLWWTHKIYYVEGKRYRRAKEWQID